VIALLSLLSATVSGLKSDACMYKKFPIFAGGSKDEEVRALQVDPDSNYIYVGGRTESSNFAPAENPHGYVYAVSPDGDWMWGQFFYNVSYAVSQVDGILLSQYGTVLNIIG
jgi:sugar lactone lactonase YvrE